MEGKYLVITCTLTVKNQEIPPHALIDCRATGIAFMDQDFACHHHIPLQELKERIQVEVIDKRPIESGDTMYNAKVGMKIQCHGEQLPIIVTKWGHYPIVLGIRWLRLHYVSVRSASNTVTFGSQYCTTHCQDTPVRIQGVTEEPPELVYQVKDIFEPQIKPQRAFRGNSVTLNGLSFFQTVRKGMLTIFKPSLDDINQVIEAKNLKERPLEEIVPKHYNEFLLLFSKVLAD